MLRVINFRMYVCMYVCIIVHIADADDVKSVFVLLLSL